MVKLFIFDLEIGKQSGEECWGDLPVVEHNIVMDLVKQGSIFHFQVLQHGHQVSFVLQWSEVKLLSNLIVLQNEETIFSNGPEIIFYLKKVKLINISGTYP